jgi:hypothetical protein
MIEVPIYRTDLVALVDDADAALATGFRWLVHRSGVSGLVYARRRFKDNGRWQTVAMHREIMGDPPGLDVDHINGNGLDNRRANLRVVSRAENLWNRHRSPAQGICRSEDGKAWRAFIDHRNARLNLGQFRDEATALAARAYAEHVLRGGPPIEFDVLWLAPQARRAMSRR